MDGLVAKLGCGGGTRCSSLRTGPHQLRLQLNFPLFECLEFPHVEVMIGLGQLGTYSKKLKRVKKTHLFSPNKGIEFSPSNKKEENVFYPMHRIFSRE